jgi:hypothetical protein
MCSSSRLIRQCAVHCAAAARPRTGALAAPCRRKRDGAKAGLDFAVPAKRKGGGGGVLDMDTAGLYRPRTKVRVWARVCAFLGARQLAVNRWIG